jgi:hypothetical protein
VPFPIDEWRLSETEKYSEIKGLWKKRDFPKPFYIPQ